MSSDAFEPEPAPVFPDGPSTDGSRLLSDTVRRQLAEGPHVKGHERLPRDCKGLHNRTMETGLYAKYMTYRTASSDYGAYTLPSADNVGSLKPHMQVVKARRTIKEMTKRCGPARRGHTAGEEDRARGVCVCDLRPRARAPLSAPGVRDAPSGRFTTDHSWGQLGGERPRQQTAVRIPEGAKPGDKLQIEVCGDDGKWETIEFVVPEFAQPYMSVKIFY